MYRLQGDALNAWNVAAKSFLSQKVLRCLSLAAFLLQNSKQRHPLSKQQPPEVATDPGDRMEQRGGARCSMPAAVSSPVEPLLWRKQSGPKLSGPSTAPIASKLELSLLSAGGDESSSAQASSSTAAAAEAASAKPLVSEMQAHIAALEREKTQLSAQLSAAHSSFQELRQAEALSTERAVMLGRAAEEDVAQQRQSASEVTKVGYGNFKCLFIPACINA